MAKRPRTRKPAAGETASAASPAAAPETAADTSVQDASPAPAVPEGDLMRVLVSSVSPKGRRRAGRGFGPEPSELHVSGATLALLEGDSQLLVKRG